MIFVGSNSVEKCAAQLATIAQNCWPTSLIFSTTVFHQLWLKILLRNLKVIITCTVYRPPDTPLTCLEDDFTASLIYMRYLWTSLCKLLMGDLNCSGPLSREARAAEHLDEEILVIT